MARKSKEFERLPTWKLRLNVWFDQLKTDMYERDFIDDLALSTSSFYDAISIIDGIPEDQKTFLNWVNKCHYPDQKNVDNLSVASPKSGHWLTPSKCMDEPLKAFFNSLDYYLCSVNSGIQPTRFKTAEQDKFAEQCLSDIAQRWDIPFISEGREQGWGDDAEVQDVSLSMLQTHGSSAIPFYLCSLASHSGISNSEISDWYIGLLCSTLIVTANFYRATNEVPEAFDSISYPGCFENKKELLGTNPNLLLLIGNFLCLPDAIPMGAFLNARYHDIDEISDTTKLLEYILLGNIDVRKRLRDLGVDYNEIIELVTSKLKTHEASARSFFPQLNGKKISTTEPFSAPRDCQSDVLILYHLYPGRSPRVEKEVIESNGRRYSKLLSCRHPNKADDSHYSWGYRGTGVQQLAYTLLDDFFNQKKSKVEKCVPNDSEVELVVHKLLSRVHSCFQYSISSKQLVYALEQPISSEQKKLRKETFVPFLAALSS